MLQVNEVARSMSDDRPTTKLPFPFKVISATICGTSAVIVEYHGYRFDGQPVPYQIEVVDPHNSLAERNVNPIGHRLYEANNLFHEVQGRVDGLIKERDDLLLQQIEMRGENERLRSQVAELRRQVENAKAKHKNGAA
jgi:hypothetical protein